MENTLTIWGAKNILWIPNILGNKKHPTEKPVELLKVLIENSSNEGDIVMDCFMGSGSTGVACIETNRKFLGIGSDKKYYDIAVRRIQEIQYTCPHLYISPNCWIKNMDMCTYADSS